MAEYQPDHATNTNPTTYAESTRPLRSRVGMVIEAANASQVVEKIIAAEKAGVEQVWMTQGGPVDTLTIYAAAASRTEKIRLGTAIVPIYPRHPFIMAQQALAINELAPGRLRLGIGTSHRPTMENVYGLDMYKPLAYLREYTTVLRTALWDGQVAYQGDYFNVKANWPRTAQMPVLVSALGEKAFEVAGEIADGAISWLCPVPYLLNQALPALQQGALNQQRSAPPIIAHTLIAVTTDEAIIQEKAMQRLAYYARLPFYRHMFESAGVPVKEDGTGLDILINTLVIHGDENRIEQQLRDLLAAGLDELLLHLIITGDEQEEREKLQQIIARL